MNVLSITRTDPTTIRSGESVDRARALMRERRLRHLPVVDAGRVLGVLSDRDIAEAIGDTSPAERCAGGAAVAVSTVPTTVGEIVPRPAITVSPDATLETAARLLIDEPVGSLLVMRDDVLVGIVTETDLLGAYIESAERDEQIGRVTASRLASEAVLDAMTERVETIRPEESIAAAHRRMRDHGFRHLLVVDADRPVGILSDRDVRRALGRESATAGAERLLRPAGGAPLGDYMTRHVFAVDVSADLAAAARRMVEHKVSALPVVENGRPVGIVTVTDILAALIEAQP